MYRYRVTVERLDAQAEGEPLQFEAENHDDIVAIAQRVDSRFGLDADATRAMIIGFKLLGEVVLKHRKEPPFSELRPALQEFAQSLKKQV